MASQIVDELRATTDAVWARLRAQLHGMESCMERSDAPGEWTTRQVLCHLLFEPGWTPGPVLFSFATTDPPVIEVTPGQTHLTPERQMMTFKQLLGTDEVTMTTWVSVVFAIHWGDHADQLAKIRKAVGLPEATPPVTAA